MTQPAAGSLELISAAKSSAILEAVVALTVGPKEAYGVLITALWRFNFELIEEPTDLEAFIVEIATSLRSLAFVPEKKARQ